VGFVLFVGFFFNPFPTGVLAGWGDEKIAQKYGKKTVAKPPTKPK